MRTQYTPFLMISMPGLDPDVALSVSDLKGTSPFMGEAHRYEDGQDTSFFGIAFASGTVLEAANVQFAADALTKAQHLGQLPVFMDNEGSLWSADRLLTGGLSWRKTGEVAPINATGMGLAGSLRIAQSIVGIKTVDLSPNG